MTHTATIKTNISSTTTEQKAREIVEGSTNGERKVFGFLLFFFQVLTIVICYGTLLTALAIIDAAVGSPIFGFFLTLLGICLFYYNADSVYNYATKVSTAITHGIYKGYKWVKSLFE